MTTAIALFSGGLDSILACRVVAAQGITVKAVKFVSPFFGHELLAREQEYVAKIRKTYGIDLILRDVSGPYCAMLANPPHGYGKNFNPCIDCKILLLREAKRLMEDEGASFLITGEVVGQRPMSQRRDTLRLIEKDSGCQGILLRPLCAKLQNPTQAELDGLVDREQLLSFRGRGRQPQIELAASFGIYDFPSPAGGCVLTDPILAKRIADYYALGKDILVADLLLLQVGRQMRLSHGGWLAMGRHEEENLRIEALRQEGDVMLHMPYRSGPMALLRYAGGEADIDAAAGLVVRFGKKPGPGEEASAVVLVEGAGKSRELMAAPLADDAFKEWYL
ncbi:MAG: thiamine biosynthesis protein [Thermodesulfobacteriota bacterium]